MPEILPKKDYLPMDDIKRLADRIARKYHILKNTSIAPQRSFPGCWDIKRNCLNYAYKWNHKIQSGNYRKIRKDHWKSCGVAEEILK